MFYRPISIWFFAADSVSFGVWDSRDTYSDFVRHLVGRNRGGNIFKHRVKIIIFLFFSDFLPLFTLRLEALPEFAEAIPLLPIFVRSVLGFASLFVPMGPAIRPNIFARFARIPFRQSFAL